MLFILQFPAFYSKTRGLGSILGDGSIHKDRHTLDIEQRSARFAMWKRGPHQRSREGGPRIAIDTATFNNVALSYS
jgi:hypothetical protein